jgi:hypothetical protein
MVVNIAQAPRGDMLLIIRKNVICGNTEDEVMSMSETVVHQVGSDSKQLDRSFFLI